MDTADLKNLDKTELKPLPNSLQNLSKDDAECKFCGIPYLILHEVQILQKRCAELESKLVEYNSAISVRFELESTVDELKSKLTELEQLPALKSEFGRLHELVNSQEEEIQTLEDQNAKLKTELISEKNLRETETAGLKKENSVLKTDLEEVHKKLKTDTLFYQNKIESDKSEFSKIIELQSQEISILSEKLGNLGKVFDENISELNSHKSSHKELVNQNLNLENKLKNVENEFNLMRSKLDSDGFKLCAARTELETLRKSGGETDTIIFKLKQKNSQLESMVDHTESQSQIAIQTFNLKIKNLTEKFEKTDFERKNVEKILQEKIDEISVLKSVESNLQKTIRESRENSTTTQKREQDLKLKIDELENELKVTINSHQSKLQELTEFYREQLNLVKNNNDSETEMTNLRAQYKKEMDQREMALKEYFQVELEIEVEKRVESLKLQFQSSLLNTEDDLGVVQNEKVALERHCEDLERQLKGNRARSSAVENELNGQLGKLKVTIEKLRGEVSDLLQKQMVVERENDKMSPMKVVHSEEVGEKIRGYERKIIELEKTVQREVEERMALLADKGVGNLGENSAFASSTLKLLSLSPGKHASGDDRNERNSTKSGSNSQKHQPMYASSPIAYVPTSLADLTKQSRPLPSLSQGSRSNYPRSTISNISASTRNTNTKTLYNDTASIKSVSSMVSQTSRKSHNKPETGSDMDALRRKIRLAIKQRQRTGK